MLTFYLDKHKGVHFEYDVKIYNLLDIEDMDLVTILGNLLDNAMEAAQRTEEKRIYLETSLRNSYWVLLVQNSSLPPLEENGHLKTYKHEKAFHGYGLKSVAKVLKRYQGDLQWDYSEQSHTFSMTVMIGTPLNKQ